MKKEGIIFVILSVCLLSGCGLGAKLPDNPIQYEQGTNEEKRRDMRIWNTETKGSFPIVPMRRNIWGTVLDIVISLRGSITMRPGYMFLN